AGRAFDRALWLDYDHDYDLDLLLFGPEPALLRNDGDGTWSDRTGDFPFDALAGGGRVTAAVRFDLVADTQGMDVAVARESGEGVLLRDLLGGRYDAAPLPELPAGTRELLDADVDHDGWTDLVSGSDDGVTALRNRHRLERHQGVEAVTISDSAGAPIALIDLENRGAADMAAGGRFLRDLGRLRFASEARHQEGGTSRSAEKRHLEEGGTSHNEEGGTSWSAAAPLSGAVALAAADFDSDGRTDLAAVTADGSVLLLRNTTDTPHRSLRVALTGVKNPQLAPGAEVEVKAGSLYQKKLYDGVPLVFGLAGHEAADAVRITWPNGLIQNETRQGAGTAATYEEAQRLSGSCPMVFTWNGEEFEFITDVLGVAPLGAAAGEGQYFDADHDEVVQIPGDALAETPDGRYEVRITEELREVGYLDRVRLLAVDHPAEIDVFTNDKFKGPPFPEFRLFGVERAARRYPAAARDHRGRDVRERLLARDGSYVDGFERDYSGLAEMHHLELEFEPGPEQAAPDGRSILVLSGWVDWADGSTFLASSQGGGPGLILPYLQVKDEAGEWVTVIQDMGIPAGKPKTIVVDLTGKWLSASREVRIVTSACVYWDEIFLAVESGGSLRPAEVPTAEADLRFRGFSGPVIHPERREPEVFVYADWRPTAMWDQTPGLYTRYGDVAELLAE
ncbi:MAG TPA: hypothetical protein VLF66_02955, partial [Thermoanaerobaculia bacterium]|nr:hypothetical protein [Thermoanaerobaculia bacterium]